VLRGLCRFRAGKLDRICQQHSVSFAQAEIKRTSQGLEYGSAEWEKFHTHARNGIETVNSQVKRTGTNDIGTAVGSYLRTLHRSKLNLGDAVRNQRPNWKEREKSLEFEPMVACIWPTVPCCWHHLGSGSFRWGQLRPSQRGHFNLSQTVTAVAYLPHDLVRPGGVS
jgi:hypothetical protein